MNDNDSLTSQQRTVTYTNGNVTNIHGTSEQIADFEADDNTSSYSIAPYSPKDDDAIIPHDTKKVYSQTLK